MAFPIIPKKRSGSAGNPISLSLGELAVNTFSGKLYLGADGGVTEIGIPVSSGTTVTERTGDGTTVAFTFSGYNGTDDGGYIVSVGGIDQPPSSYSISNTAGGTITFSAAPTAGELISIRAIVSGPAVGGDATSLRGINISQATPTTGEALVYNGASWEANTPPTDATKLQGRNISSTAPTDKQSLVWDAATNVWKPATGAGADIGGRAWSATETYTEGDLVATSQRETWICIQAVNTGNDPTTSPLWWQPMPADAVSLQLVPVATTTPTTGQGLVYNGTSWAPATPAANATSLQGTAITPDIIPNPLEVLTWAQVNGGGGAYEWRPRPLAGASSPAEGQGLVFSTNAGWLAGDVNAFKIRNQTVVTTSPAQNEALVYNGTDWAPAPVNAVQLQTKPISSFPPSLNNLLQFDGTSWAPFDGIAVPNWNTSQSYSLGDKVYYQGLIYINRGSATSTNPAADPANWEQASGGSSSPGPTDPVNVAYWMRINFEGAYSYIPIYR
jgi:hypothetical protein